MIAFEIFLIDQGYQVYHMDTKKMLYVKGWQTISSMHNIDNRYSKQIIVPGKHPFDLIIVGLHDHGFPPYVSYPVLKDARKDIEELSNKELLIKLNQYR